MKSENLAGDNSSSRVRAGEGALRFGHAGLDARLAAQWAVDICDAAGLSGSGNIRRLHYFASLAGMHYKPDGQLYRDTAGDFSYLRRSLDFAGFMGLTGHGLDVPCAAMAGRWNEMLCQEFQRACDVIAGQMVREAMDVHLEIWLERSSAFELVEKAASSYGLTTVASPDEIALDDIRRFAGRVRGSNKPVRILYLTDYSRYNDFAALRIEGRIRAVLAQQGLSENIDFRLDQLLLTEYQCRELGLFDMRLGDYAKIEIDAAYAVSPDWVEGVLFGQIESYIDRNGFLAAESGARRGLAEIRADIYRLIGSGCDLDILFRSLKPFFRGVKAKISPSEFQN
jgi:hypothetical protein